MIWILPELQLLRIAGIAVPARGTINVSRDLAAKVRPGR
jgi:hypothetical protein